MKVNVCGKCVVPKNIHTSPTEESFSKDPSNPALWKFHTFFKYLVIQTHPTLQEIPIPSVGGVWIFFGMAQY